MYCLSLYIYMYIYIYIHVYIYESMSVYIYIYFIITSIIYIYIYSYKYITYTEVRVYMYSQCLQILIFYTLSSVHHWSPVRLGGFATKVSLDGQGLQNNSESQESAQND